MRNRSALALVSLTALLGACTAAQPDDNAQDDAPEELGETSAALTAGIDLHVTKVSAPASSEGWTTANATVCNRGSVAAGESVLRISLTSESTPSYVIPFGERPVPALAGGECADLSVEGVGPWRSAWLLGATADVYNTVAERIETNNFRAGKRIAFGPLPDLHVASVTAPTNISDFMTWTVSARVCNRGSDRADPTRVDFYVSSDTAITESDAFVGGAPIPSLDIGACADVSTLVSSVFPRPVTDEIRVVAKADGPGWAMELNEANNTRATGPMGYGFGPDFTIPELVTPATSDYETHSFATTVKVCNEGTTSGYVPDISIVRTADDFIVGRGYVQNELAAGACASITVNVDGLMFPIDGIHTFAAVVDVYGTAPELQKGNNRSAERVVAIGRGPDLYVKSMSAPASVSTVPWGAFDTTIRVCNQGTRPSEATFVTLLRSDDKVYDDHDYGIGRADLLPLNVGQCRNVIVNATAGGPAGSYFLAAKVQPPIDELNPTNNTRSRAIAVTD